MTPEAGNGPLGSPTPDVWAFHAHVAAWAVVAFLLLTYAVVAKIGKGRWGPKPTRKQLACLAGGLLSLAIATTWPLADLAAHWSLTALLFQRLLLTLAAAPLLMLSVPSPVFARLTRAPLMDNLLRHFTKPVVAVLVFSAVAVGTLSTSAVAAQSSSVWARGGIDALLLMGGGLLWAPVLRHVPGAYRTTPMGTAVYLFVQSIVPTLPAVIYIFARHPIYPVFDAAHRALGVSPLADQQIAGVVAKVATLPVLWTVAWVSLARAHSTDRDGTDSYPLTWAEVERQLERAERAQRAERAKRSAGAQKHRHMPRVKAIPRPVPGSWFEVVEPPGAAKPPGAVEPPGAAKPPGAVEPPGVVDPPGPGAVPPSP
jgi:putative membrane protein